MSYPYRYARVIFTDPNSFGVETLLREENVLHKLEQLICLDIGCSEETLESLDEIRLSGVNVLLVDHHPLRLETAEKYPDLKIYHNTEHCTASLLYYTFSKMKLLIGADYPWSEIWTIIAIYADVAKEKTGANALLHELSTHVPWLVTQLEHENPLNWEFQPASQISFLFNAARRVAFRYGAAICLKACCEVEKSNDLFTLLRDPPYSEWEKYPNVVLLRKLSEDYRRESENVSVKYIDLDNCVLAILETQVDIGGIIAKSASRRFNKPAFAVNMSLSPVKFSGRCDSGADLNLVMGLLNSMSMGKIAGGGHPQAVGGFIRDRPSLSEFCMYLKLAFQKMTADGSTKSSSDIFL